MLVFSCGHFIGQKSYVIPYLIVPRLFTSYNVLKRVHIQSIFHQECNTMDAWSKTYLGYKGWGKTFVHFFPKPFLSLFPFLFIFVCLCSIWLCPDWVQQSHSWKGHYFGVLGSQGQLFIIHGFIPWGQKMAYCMPWFCFRIFRVVHF